MADQTNNNMPWKKFLLVLNCIILCIGTCFGPLILRLYFIKGGKRIWFSSWLETGGWPLTFIPLLISYINRKKSSRGTKLFFMNQRVFVASGFIGILTGLDNYLYAYGASRLPVSTSALIIASQLAFTAFFAFLMVKQKFTSYSTNSIFLLTLSSVVLGLHTKSDRPQGETNKMYILGFVMTVGAALVYGIVLPMVELMYRHAKQRITYTLVLEVQLVTCIFATGFCTIGMLVNKDFQAIGREAKEYELGENKYYLVVIGNTIVWQCFFLGIVGVICCASSLLSAILIAVFLPVTEILAVIIYHEKFTAEKAVSLVLSIWGFVSYFYGEMKQNKKSKKLSLQSQENNNNNQVRAAEMITTPVLQP